MKWLKWRFHPRVMLGIIVLLLIVGAQLYAFYNLKAVENSRHKFNEKMALYTSSQGMKYIMRNDDFDQRKHFIIAALVLLNLFTAIYIVLFFWVIRANQQLRQEEIAKSDMISTITHNARHFLSVINSRLDLLKLRRHPQEKEKMDRDINLMTINLQAINHLIENLNENEMLSNDRYEVHCRPVNLNHLLQDGVDSHAELAKDKGVHVNLRPLEEPVVVSADRPLLQQALLNVIHNAVKFTAFQTIVKINVRCDGERAFIDIHDQGSGIPAEKFEEIFQPYVRLNNSIRGTGLGLGNARRCMRLMGGDLVLTSSQPGQGSVFTLSCLLPKPSEDIA